jgi:hypothetical protein
MAHRDELTKVASLNDIRLPERLKHSFSLGRHLRVAGHDVLPALVGEANRYAVDGIDNRQRFDRAASVVQSSTTTLYGRNAFGCTSRISSSSGFVIVGVGDPLETIFIVVTRRSQG